MKTIITFIFALLLGCLAMAQNGINYKAQLKDDSGNSIAGTNVVVLFTIYEGDALIDDVYVEQHAYTTDANGFVILNIGMGNTVDNFSAINWADDEHFLNVQVNVDGAGLTDLGTTQFKTVPYAITSGDAVFEKDGDNAFNLNGNIGIGTSSPTERLHIEDADNASILLKTPNVNDTSSLTLENGVPTGVRTFFKIENRSDFLRIGVDSDITPQTGYNPIINISTAGNISTTGNIASGGSLRLETGATVSEFSTDGTLNGNSNAVVPTERAVKTYVDNTVATAGPLAYGSISEDDTVNSGSGNFSVFKRLTNQYEITIVGETYNTLDYTTVLTPVNSSIGSFRTGDFDGKIVVALYSNSGNIVGGNFHFITYK